MEAVWSQAVVLSPMKLTPRTWLACERTLLAWLHMSAILAAVATGIQFYGCDQLRLTSIMMMIPAIIFVLYASIMYYRRLHQLQYRQLSTHNDQRGPFLLTVVMCSAVSINLVWSLYGRLSPHTDSFVYP